MGVAYSCSAKKNYKIMNMCGLPEVNSVTKGDYYPLPFTGIKLDGVTIYDRYSFMGGFFWMQSNFNIPTTPFADCFHILLGNFCTQTYAL